jgi:hypothetical protein
MPSPKPSLQWKGEQFLMGSGGEEAMLRALWILSAAALMVATLAAQTAQKSQQVKVTFIVDGMT